MAEGEARLVVAIRPRPLADGEQADAGLSWDGLPDTVRQAGSAQGQPASELPFDRVFAAAAPNGEVYSAVALPIVQAALRGVNGAVAAYGQTGSGKTRTMRGTAEDAGVVQRAVRALRPRRRGLRRRAARRRGGERPPSRPPPADCGRLRPCGGHAWARVQRGAAVHRDLQRVRARPAQPGGGAEGGGVRGARRGHPRLRAAGGVGGAGASHAARARRASRARRRCACWPRATRGARRRRRR